MFELCWFLSSPRPIRGAAAMRLLPADQSGKGGSPAVAARVSYTCSQNRETKLKAQEQGDGFQPWWVVGWPLNICAITPASAKVWR